MASSDYIAKIDESQPILKGATVVGGFGGYSTIDRGRHDSIDDRIDDRLQIYDQYVAGLVAGDVRISGSTIDHVNVTGAITVAGLTFPTGTGDNGQFLTTDGSGSLDWTNNYKTYNIGNDYTSAVTTGTGKIYFTVPTEADGMVVKETHACLCDPATSGLSTFQVYHIQHSGNVLSIPVTIDANEYNSYSATTAHVVDTGNNGVTAGDVLRIDVSGIGIGAKGLNFHLVFGVE